MAYRPYTPPPPYALTITLSVTIAVELLRSHLHPNLGGVVPYPRMVAFASVLATLAITLWNMPDTRPKLAVSAFFTAASMYTLLLLLIAFVSSVWSR